MEIERSGDKGAWKKIPCKDKGKQSDGEAISQTILKITRRLPITKLEACVGPIFFMISKQEPALQTP